ncbi:MAG TPA: GNVR domain-containing protein, partial [Nevskia sp.]|nr:GNVR domain-containing protein [Nevskia sp.]
MSNNIEARSRLQQSLAVINQGSGVEAEEVNLRQIAELLIASRWVVLGIALTFMMVGIFYLVVSDRTYEADGMVQVEDDSKSSALSNLNDLSSLLVGSTVKTEAEIQILQSHMVLDQVIDKMNFLVGVRPKYFPVLGHAIARWNKKRTGPVSALPGFGSYAWGGERVEVPTFDIPDDLVGERFSLVAGDNAYTLLDSHDGELLKGKVGESAAVETASGRITLFVRTLVARPGTVFYLDRRAREDVYKSLYKRLIVAEQGKQSGVIQLQYSGSSPDEVFNVVNSIEDAYLRQNVERRSEEAARSLEFLNRQLPDLKEKVDVAQANLNAYQLKHGTVDVSQETEQVLKSSVDLEARRLELMQQREEALQRFTAEHPVIKAIDEQLQIIQSAQARTKKDTESLPTTQQDVLGLMRDVEVATQLYTTMLDTIQQLQVARAGTIGNVRIVDRPLKPRTPSSPRPVITLALSLFGGLLFGVVYVFVKHALLRGLDDPGEVERRFGLVTFASIPYSSVQTRLARQMKGRPGMGDASYVLAVNKGDEVVAEALRSLRTSLHFALIESPNNVLMITGPSPGIGKSFISVNLAAVLALSDKKVVLLDADLRRGHINSYFGGEVKPGITDYLVGDADAASIIRPSGVKGLDYLARGTTPPNPAELLLNEKF